MSDARDKKPTRIEELCAKHGLRMTGPRRIIAQVLAAAEDHPNVEELWGRVHEIDPRISLSTVYRTVKLFEEKGILERHEFLSGRGHYEAAPREHHDHLIDVETGQVIEFRNDEIEKLQERIAKELGFRLVGHRLELYGEPVTRKRKPS